MGKLSLSFPKSMKYSQLKRIANICFFIDGNVLSPHYNTNDGMERKETTHSALIKKNAFTMFSVVCEQWSNENC